MKHELTTDMEIIASAIGEIKNFFPPKDIGYSIHYNENAKKHNFPISITNNETLKTLTVSVEVISMFWLFIKKHLPTMKTNNDHNVNVYLTKESQIKLLIDELGKVYKERMYSSPMKSENNDDDDDDANTLTLVKKIEFHTNKNQHHHVHKKGQEIEEQSTQTQRINPKTNILQKQNKSELTDEQRRIIKEISEICERSEQRRKERELLEKTSEQEKAPTLKL